jgi:S-(hydroxymethyl)glutathione dehydrogenase/alcohol dehydrogenase
MQLDIRLKDLLQTVTVTKTIIVLNMIIPKLQILLYEPANPLHVINWMCQAARKYSTISIPGVYGSAYDKFPLGQLFQLELQIRLGQCPVKKYNEQLLHLIETKRIDPTKIVSHTMKLEDAPKAYEIFDKKKDVTKVVLKP